MEILVIQKYTNVPTYDPDNLRYLLGLANQFQSLNPRLPKYLITSWIQSKLNIPENLDLSDEVSKMTNVININSTIVNEFYCIQKSNKVQFHMKYYDNITGQFHDKYFTIAAD